MANKMIPEESQRASHEGYDNAGLKTKCPCGCSMQLGQHIGARRIN